MRPPFGFRGPHLSGVVRRAGFRGVAMWSRWAFDWEPQPVPKLIERLRPVRSGDIVLLHDGDHRRLEGDRQATLAAVDCWLPMWKNAGVGFVTLDELNAEGAVMPALPPEAIGAERQPGARAAGHGAD